MMKTGGEPKDVVTGRKGNVGGIPTPGRQGHTLKGSAALMMLVKPGPAINRMPKTAKHNPETKTAKIDAGNVKPRGAAPKTAAGSPRNLSMGSGNAKGKLTPFNPEPAIGKDSAGVISHKK